MTLGPYEIKELKNILGKEKRTHSLTSQEKDVVRSIVSQEAPGIDTKDWKAVSDYALAMLGAHRLSAQVEDKLRSIYE